MAERIKDYAQTSKDLWNFVIDFQTGILHDVPLTNKNAVAIHDIIEAAREVVSSEVSLYKMLNNANENVIT